MAYKIDFDEILENISKLQQFWNFDIFYLKFWKIDLFKIEIISTFDMVLLVHCIQEPFVCKQTAE